MVAVAAPTMTGQVGLKVDAEELALVNQFLASRNVDRMRKREPKEYPQHYLRPAWDELVETARKWKAKQK
jgi:hypothetical protein